MFDERQNSKIAYVMDAVGFTRKERVGIRDEIVKML